MSKHLSELLAHPFNMKTLWPLYDILRAIINLGIDHTNNINVIDKHYNKKHHNLIVDF